jgi:hypothetical protein
MEVTMSAMPAVVLTSDSDVRPARRAGAQISGEAAVVLLHGGPRVPPRPALRQQHAFRPSATPAGAPAAPLRLTRRGRVVVTAVAALLAAVVSLLVAGAAQATNHGLSPHEARQNLVQVVVRPGQSLWSVAENADPDQDTRAVIQQIIDLNSLSGDTVAAGQQLWVPRG